MGDSSSPGPRRLIAEWLLRPLITACFVMILLGIVLVSFSKQPSLLPLRDAIIRKFSDQYERRLSPALIAELRAGGFTLFIRHGSRDGPFVASLAALDRASLLDKGLVPAEHRTGLCLNDLGRVESRLLGHFITRARIPVKEVVSSPICRARETAELSVGRVNRFELALAVELADAGTADHAAFNEQRKRLLEEIPAPGTNRMLFSHQSVLSDIGYERLFLAESGMVIFQHTGAGLRLRAIVTLREMMYALPLGTQGKQ